MDYAEERRQGQKREGDSSRVRPRQQPNEPDREQRGGDEIQAVDRQHTQGRLQLERGDDRFRRGEYRDQYPGRRSRAACEHDREACNDQ